MATAILSAGQVGGQAAGTPTVTLKVDGEKLTGRYSSQVLGEIDFTGKVKDKTFTFSLTIDGIGAVAYEGSLLPDDTLKGTISLAGLGEGSFTGVRKK